jgi:hypothetical protein
MIMSKGSERKHFDLGSVPLAGGFGIMCCDDRSHVHFVLFDGEDADPVLQITLTREQLHAAVHDAEEALAAGSSLGLGH